MRSKSRGSHTHFPVTSDRITLKGINLPSIIEPPVPVSFNGQPLGKFQGIELYQNCPSGRSPQVLVDLVSNFFFRLSYLHQNHQTATFATSFVGTPSFRTDDKKLHYLPTIERVNATADAKEFSVEISGSFAEQARVLSRRTYSTNNLLGHTEMRLSVSFEALQDIELDERSLGNDAFRFFSFSSMYAGDVYDADLLRFTAHDGAEENHEIRDFSSSSRHFFNRSLPLQNIIQLLNRGTSTGSAHGPGAKDAPSYRARIEEPDKRITATSGIEFGVQGYYTKSDDINADSLSVWAEWRNAPPVIVKGTELTVDVTVEAFAPGE